MKLNKPPVTESKSVLEDYVSYLLIDSSTSLKEKPPEKLSTIVNLHDNLTKDKTNQTTNIDRAFKLAKERNDILSGILEDVAPPKDDFSGSEKVNILDGNNVKENTLENTTEKNVIKEKNFNQESKALKDDNQNKQKYNNNTQIDESSHTTKVNQEIEEYSQRKFKDEPEVDSRLESVEKLLAKIALANIITPKEHLTTEKQDTSVDSNTVDSSKEATEANIESTQASFSHREKQPLKNILGNVFQTLVFEVSQLPLAVPLVKLGGIVNINQKEITPLVGTPKWFMGLIPHEKGNLMVVDTQKFLMPERSNIEKKPYDFLIILDDSLWALGCHSVGEAKNLSPEDVRWSSGTSKRPWFAGMVVEYMSALIEVDNLINMLAENVVD